MCGFACVEQQMRQLSGVPVAESAAFYAQSSLWQQLRRVASFQVSNLVGISTSHPYTVHLCLGCAGCIAELCSVQFVYHVIV